MARWEDGDSPNSIYARFCRAEHSSGAVTDIRAEVSFSHFEDFGSIELSEKIVGELARFVRTTTPPQLTNNQQIEYEVKDVIFAISHNFVDYRSIRIGGAKIGINWNEFIVSLEKCFKGIK